MKVGDKVKVAINNYGVGVNGETGIIVNMIDNIAIVNLDNNVTAKVRVSDLIKIDQNHDKQESKPEIPEGVRVITKKEFIDALVRVTSPENLPGGMDAENPMRNVVGSMVGMIVGKGIVSALFDERNAVTLTKDKLANILWLGCSPKHTRSFRSDDFLIPIAAIMSLHKLLEIFFPSGSEERK